LFRDGHDDVTIGQHDRPMAAWDELVRLARQEHGEKRVTTRSRLNAAVYQAGDLVAAPHDQESAADRKAARLLALAALADVRALAPRRSYLLAGRADVPRSQSDKTCLVLLPRGGSGMAVLAALLDLLLADPEATVLLVPSDYDAGDRRVLRRAMAGAVSHADEHGVVVLLGATAGAPRADARWIVSHAAPDLVLGSELPMAQLVASPGPGALRRLMASEACHDTGIVAAKGRDLFNLYERAVPRLVRLMLFSAALGDTERAPFAETLTGIGSLDLFSDVLALAGDLRLWRLDDSAGFTDLGTLPRRLAWWVAQHGASAGAAYRRVAVRSG
jgi:hypothetical protein